MTRYNHAFTLAFEVISDAPDGEDVTGAMLRAGLLRRIQNMGDAEFEEACGEPFDSMVEGS